MTKSLIMRNGDNKLARAKSAERVGEQDNLARFLLIFCVRELPRENILYYIYSASLSARARPRSISRGDFQ